jgi:hypothetical protein
MGVIEQIKTAYEVENLTPEQIASPDNLNLDVAAVKCALMQHSSKYRKDCGKEEEDEDDLNFSNDDLRVVNKTFVAALQAEDNEGLPDWRVRLDAAKYIRDDKKGRKEVVKQVGNTFNFMQFNEDAARAREKLAKVMGNSKALNV